MCKVTIELNVERARRLLYCLMRTNASGKDLDVGIEVEEELRKFLKDNEKGNE